MLIGLNDEACIGRDRTCGLDKHGKGLEAFRRTSCSKIAADDWSALAPDVVWKNDRNGQHGDGAGKPSRQLFGKPVPIADKPDIVPPEKPSKRINWRLKKDVPIS